MNFVITSDLPIKALRVIASQKREAYDGSITLEFLDDFFSICSISDIWRLMLEANSSIIQSVAKDKLDEILKEYDNEEDIK